VAGDVGATIRALLPKLHQRTDRAFLDDMLGTHARKLDHVIEAYTSGIDKLTPMHPEYVARVLDEEAAEDAVFTVDTGMCCTWSARYLTPNGRRRIIGSWVHGSMANALPRRSVRQRPFPTGKSCRCPATAAWRCCSGNC
jgi:pyruvate dehydrogenase (quinone)